MKKRDRFYCYIWVNQRYADPIYQLVQAAHVAMVIGQKMNPKFNAHKIYYQICKVPEGNSIQHLAGKLVMDGYNVERFYEPDIDRAIAIGIHPVRADKRKHLKEYQLLTFE